MQYLSVGFIGFVVFLLVRARLRQKAEIKQVQKANLDVFDFAYQIETKFGTITSSERKAVQDVRGKNMVLRVPCENYGAWLAIFDPKDVDGTRHCTNYFFYQKAIDAICPTGELTSEMLLDYLDLNNFILR